MQLKIENESTLSRWSKEFNAHKFLPIKLCLILNVSRKSTISKQKYVNMLAAHFLLWWNLLQITYNFTCIFLITGWILWISLRQKESCELNWKPWWPMVRITPFQFEQLTVPTLTVIRRFAKYVYFPILYW